MKCFSKHVCGQIAYLSQFILPTKSETGPPIFCTAQHERLQYSQRKCSAVLFCQPFRHAKRYSAKMQNCPPAKSCAYDQVKIVARLEKPDLLKRYNYFYCSRLFHYRLWNVIGFVYEIVTELMLQTKILLLN